MVRAQAFLLDDNRALERRLRFVEAPRAHIDVGEEIERLADRGAVTAGSLLADRERAFVVVLRLRVAAFAKIGVAKILERIAHHHLIGLRRAVDSAQGTLLNSLQ